MGQLGLSKRQPYKENGANMGVLALKIEKIYKTKNKNTKTI